LGAWLILFYFILFYFILKKNEMKKKKNERMMESLKKRTIIDLDDYEDEELQQEVKKQQLKKDESIPLAYPLIEFVCPTDLLNSVVPMSSRRPRFLNQITFEQTGCFQIDLARNHIILIKDILSPLVLQEYLEAAMKVERTSSRSAYGQMKPRKEVCYTPTGQPYVYSKIAHPTKPYPPHVRKIMPLLEQAIDRKLSMMHQPLRPWLRPTSAVDICYDATFKQGGSISAHSDDEENWGMVLIFSLGQTRYLRIKDKTTKEWWNVELTHNSLAVMYGATFQDRYTHQVDKLVPGEPVGTRLSLNIRYLE
jgi:alkylated DNA repair dioxygenase AlkB